MNTLSAKVRISDLVRESPGRARVLEQFGIEYCCSGTWTLGEACTARHLAFNEVASAISAYDRSVDADVEDWNHAPLARLIDHIVEEHHGYLREELPRIESLFQKLITTHGAKYPELAACADVFVDLRYELECHMMQEEQALFPALRRLETRDAGDPIGKRAIGIGEPVSVMEHEHARSERALIEMRRIMHGYEAPASACASHLALIDSLKRLERDLHEHISEENNILFPRALELGDEIMDVGPAD